MLHRLLRLEPGDPLWLFSLRLAARLSNYLLLAFALFGLVFLGNPDPLIVAYLLLIVIFGMVNLRAISAVKRAFRPSPEKNGDRGAVTRLKTWAHILSAALPLAYVAGAWQTGLFDTMQIKQAIAVTAPPLLNWLAIEQTLAVQSAHVDDDC